MGCQRCGQRGALSSRKRSRLLLERHWRRESAVIVVPSLPAWHPLLGHRTMIRACPRRTGPKGGNATPSGIPAIPRYGNGAPAGKTCFANPRLRPPRPDSVRPAPRAHSGTRPETDAKKTRSAQTGFLLYAVTGLRSSTHSNGKEGRAGGIGLSRDFVVLVFTVRKAPR